MGRGVVVCMCGHGSILLWAVTAKREGREGTARQRVEIRDMCGLYAAGALVGNE